MTIPSFYTLEQCDRVTLENNTMPYIKSYYSCLHRVVGDGFNDEFSFSSKGIRSNLTNREYATGEYSVLNMFRFEGSGNKSDNVLMYMLETQDGLKGTLIASGNTDARNSVTM
jgi:hypothetical protein